MSKLYLVRKNLELYLGPMDIVEFKDGYKKLKFGPDAEVCTSLKKWVKLSDHHRLAARYPQIASIVNRAAIWQQSMIPVQIKDDHAIKTSTPRRTSSFYSTSIILSILILIVVFAFMYNRGIGPFNHKRITTQTASMLLESKRESDFLKYMDNHIALIVPDVVKQRSSYDEWIPYLRYYAYKNNGSIVGIKPKLLKGTLSASNVLPDCSVETLKSKLIEEQKTDWSSILQGTEVPSTNFERMFFWDPYWIKLRVDSSWIQPINYYHACTQMLYQVIKQDQFILTSDVKSILESRLAHSLNILSSKSGFRYDILETGIKPKDNILEALSCIEDGGRVETCINKDKLSSASQGYLGVRSNRMEVFYYLSSIIIKESILSEDLAELYKLKSKLKVQDQITLFNYSNEYQLISYMQSTSGSIKDSKKLMEQNYPDIYIK